MRQCAVSVVVTDDDGSVHQLVVLKEEGEAPIFWSRGYEWMALQCLITATMSAEEEFKLHRTFKVPP